jgi:hypothetical protein
MGGELSNRSRAVGERKWCEEEDEHHCAQQVGTSRKIKSKTMSSF